MLPSIAWLSLSFATYAYVFEFPTMKSLSPIANAPHAMSSSYRALMLGSDMFETTKYCIV